MKNIAIVALVSLLATLVLAEGKGGHFIENWDLDGDGLVTLAEAQERRSDVFSSFDANDDGQLNAEEYDQFDAAREADMKENGGGEGHGMGPMKKVQAGMKRDFNDVDGDGQVSRDEFVGKSADWIALLDKNGDGAISADDMGH